MKENFYNLDNDVLDIRLWLIEQRENTNFDKETIYKIIDTGIGLSEKVDNMLEKINDIDGYIEEIKGNIEYKNLIWELEKDGLLTEELKLWLNNYMRLKNNKEEYNVWDF